MVGLLKKVREFFTAGLEKGRLAEEEPPTGEEKAAKDERAREVERQKREQELQHQGEKKSAKVATEPNRDPDA